MDSKNTLNYLKSGVDLSKAANLKENMKSLLSKHQKEHNIGNFGGLFEIKHYKNPVLISSITKKPSNVKKCRIENNQIQYVIIE